jgi:hypothetical protein
LNEPEESLLGGGDGVFARASLIVVCRPECRRRVDCGKVMRQRSLPSWVAKPKLIAQFEEIVGEVH